ncbi:MAG: EamA family transporter [Alphaproteobacteria bacterium]|jgi:drug/metabolite transporter (DMT)-like permease|nr:EamA family transporter [Alphaproteobacteria bacterium]MBT7941789.1 EamA family transporter [Alphaproteobacteria bacterium]
MLRHTLLLFLLALIWSASFLAIKVGVETFPPLTLTAGRVVLAAAVVVAFAWFRGERLPREPRVWVYCILLGFFGNALPFTLINWGEEHVDSGQAAILMAVMPMVTTVLAHFFTIGDRMTPTKVAGVIVGFAGVVVLVGPEAVKGLGGDLWRQLAVSGGAMCYSIAVILTRNMPPSPLLSRSAGVLISSVVMMLPVALVIDQPWTLVPTTEGWLAMVYLGLFPTALATIVLFYLVQQRGPSFVAYSNYLIPIFAVLWGTTFLDEVLSPRVGTALVVILCGMVITQIRRRA